MRPTDLPYRPDALRAGVAVSLSELLRRAIKVNDRSDRFEQALTRSTTVRDLRIVVATVSVCGPQIMVSAVFRSLRVVVGFSVRRALRGGLGVRLIPRWC